MKKENKLKKINKNIDRTIIKGEHFILIMNFLFYLISSTQTIILEEDGYITVYICTIDVLSTDYIILLFFF